MITYNPSDPTSEIIFNLNGVCYEHRKLATPDASFILGEWVGLGANQSAVKIDSSSFVVPAMVYTETGRHDVAESEGITVAKGFFHLSTMNYVASQSFAIGDQVVVSASGGIGKLSKLSGSAGSYLMVGVVRIPPAVDGVSRLVVEIYPNPIHIAVP